MLTNSPSIATRPLHKKSFYPKTKEEVETEPQMQIASAESTLSLSVEDATATNVQFVQQQDKEERRGDTGGTMRRDRIRGQ